MRISTFLIFNGNCAEALEFYQRAFDAPEPEIMRYGQMPPDPAFILPPGARNLILHATLRVGESILYLSDNVPGQPFEERVGDRMFITLEKLDVKTATRLYDRLREGGTDLMPLKKTFWSPAFAMLIDRFGIKWMIGAD